MLEELLAAWQEFAKRHVFVFRAVDPVLYELRAPGYLRAIIDNSSVEMMADKDGHLRACLVYSRHPGSDETTVHWAWTATKCRNLGLQRELWAKVGITPASVVVISCLTVVSERMKDKYGWMYWPGIINERNA